MIANELPRRTGTPAHLLDLRELETFGDDALECRMLICPEKAGGYSVHALGLPGVVSQGDTFDEAVANMTEAFQGAIAVYRESDQPIPWSDDAVLERPEGSVERWIRVHV